MPQLSTIRFLVVGVVWLLTALALAQPAEAPAPGPVSASFDDVAAEPAPTPVSPSAPSAQPDAPVSAAPAAPPVEQPRPAAQPAPSTDAPAPTLDGSTYVVRLRDLEARVDELKEQIRRSHTRLSLLSETILAGGVGGARAEIVLANELSSAFKVTRALVVLDGAVQYNKQDDEDALGDQNEIPVFSGSIPPGDHQVQVSVKIRGHGYGMFSYLRGYEFELKSSHAFTVTEGKTVQLRVVAWEKGGVTTPLEQRPAVRYVEKIRTGNEPRSGARTSVGAAVGAEAR